MSSSIVIRLARSRAHRAVIHPPCSALSSLSHLRSYASVKHDSTDESQDYEIDLVTLKKKKKGKLTPPSSSPSAPSSSTSSTSSPSSTSSTSSSTSSSPVSSFTQEFESELKILRNFLNSSPMLKDVVSNRSRLNNKVIESLLMRFKTSFFRDYLSNQLKCDVTKIYQMCNQLQKDESLFKGLFSPIEGTKSAANKPKDAPELTESKDDQINDILKIFNKPLEKRKRKDSIGGLNITRDLLSQMEKDEATNDDYEVKLDEYIGKTDDIKSDSVKSSGSVPKSSSSAASAATKSPTSVESAPAKSESSPSTKKSRSNDSTDYNSAAKLLKLTKKKSSDTALILEKEIKSRSINPGNGVQGGQDSAFLSDFVNKMTLGSSSTEDANLNQLTASEIRSKYSKLQNHSKVTASPTSSHPAASSASTSTTSSHAKDVQDSLESIDSFLKKLKQSSEQSKEESFRTQRAYEWSKAQLSDNMMEDGRFFSPRMIPGTLIPFNALNPFNYRSNIKNNDDLLFPSLKNKKQDREYLLLTSSGKTINCGLENPLGFNYIPKDLFTILSNMENPEVFIKHIRKLSKKNWKLIGGNDDKILIFARTYKQRYFYKWIMRFFTMVGMLSTALILGSFFIDDKDFQLKNLKKVIAEKYGDEESLLE